MCKGETLLLVLREQPRRHQEKDGEDVVCFHFQTRRQIFRIQIPVAELLALVARKRRGIRASRIRFFWMPVY